MNDNSIRNPAYLSLTDQQLSEIDALCDRFDQELVKGDAPRIESFLVEASEAARDGLLAELLGMEIEYRSKQGEAPKRGEYIPRFPEQRSLITGVFAREATAEFSGNETKSIRAIVPTEMGNFRLIEEIGHGGMGIVLRAHDKKLKRDVAIKLLAPHLAADAEAVQRFVREAQSAAAVRHDNVVTIHAVDEANGSPFLVMELINGESLQDRINRGPLPTDEIVQFGIRIASGLDAAHRCGLIHRDIKPANILLESHSEPGEPSVVRVKITDFGLARVTSESAMTRHGFIAGTPLYMSPEQANGEPTDHRSDLFSLGSVLYSLCTGQVAFPAESAIAVLRRVSDHEPEPIRSKNPAIPEWLCDVIAKLMAKQPEDRIQSAKEVADLLTRCKGDAAVSGAPALDLVSRGASPSGQSMTANANAHERPGTNAPRLARRTFIALALLVTVVLAVVFNRSLDPKTTDLGVTGTNPLGGPAVKNRHPFLDDTYEWTPPVELGPGINGDGLVDHASISSDGLLMVMARIEKGSQKWQLWWSARKSDRDPFPAAAPLPSEVNSDWNDLTPFLSRDGLSLWFASDRPGGAGNKDLYVSRRKSVKDPFEHPASLGPTINTGDDETSPFVTADELTLLFAAGVPRRIFQAQRKSKEDSFSAPQLLANVNDMFWQEFPRLSRDGLTLVMAVSRGDSTEQRLEVASRPTVDADFSKPVDLGSVNSGIMSGPSLSGDETTLYFSNGTNKTQGLWMSRRVKKQPPAKPEESAEPDSSPPPAVAPFDEKAAQAHQQAWADHLGLSVEFTNTIGMKFRLVPPGEFLMGSTPEEIEAELKRPGLYGHLVHWRKHIESEGPQHKVVLTKPIYVGVTEVTQSQYEQVMGTTPSQFSATGEGKEVVANLETGNYPVEMVSFNESVEFCARLSQHEHLEPFNFLSDQTVTTLKGTGYRLPTEAEWEFACRAGTTTRFWSGDENEELIQVGWCSSNAGGRTHAVGEFKANPFGLSDMHGNVWEWVQDGWDPQFYGQFQENVATDPFSPLSAGTMPMRRGGSFMQVPELVRSSSRLLYHTDNEMGFRVVLVVEGLLVSDPGDSPQSNDQSQSDVPANTQATPDQTP